METLGRNGDMMRYSHDFRTRGTTIHANRFTFSRLAACAAVCVALALGCAIASGPTDAVKPVPQAFANEQELAPSATTAFQTLVSRTAERVAMAAQDLETEDDGKTKTRITLSPDTVEVKLGDSAVTVNATCTTTDGLTSVAVSEYRTTVALDSGTDDPEKYITITATPDGAITIEPKDESSAEGATWKNLYCRIAVTATPADDETYQAPNARSISVTITREETPLIDLADAVIGDDALVYTGNPQNPSISVTLDGNPLDPSAYALLYYSDSACTQQVTGSIIAAGTYYVKATAADDAYTGTSSGYGTVTVNKNGSTAPIAAGVTEGGTVTLNLVRDAEGLRLPVTNAHYWTAHAMSIIGAGGEDCLSVAYDDEANEIVLTPIAAGNADVRLSVADSSNYEDASLGFSVEVVYEVADKPTWELLYDDESTAPVYTPGLAQAGVTLEPAPSDDDPYVLSGDTAVDAGTHVARVTLKDGYAWDVSGNRDDLTQEWAIRRATPELLTDLPDNATEFSVELAESPEVERVELTAYIGDNVADDYQVTLSMADSGDSRVAGAEFQQTRTGGVLFFAPRAIGDTTVVISTSLSPEASANLNETSVAVTLHVTSDDIVVQKPTLELAYDTTPVYDGSETRGVNVTPVDAADLEDGAYAVTDAVGTDAGDYTARVSLADGHVWSDGTYDDLTLEWSIDRATPTLSASPSTVVLNVVHNPEAVVAIEYDGDGGMGVGGYDEDLIDIAIGEGNASLFLTAKAVGQTSITISTSASKNYEAAEAISIPVSVVDTLQSVDAPVIHVNEGLVYTGLSQQGVYLDSADTSTAYRLEGDVSATDAGDYTARLVLNSGFTWSDDVTDDDLVAHWSIDKAPMNFEAETSTALSIIDDALGRVVQVGFPGDWDGVSMHVSDDSVVAASITAPGMLTLTPRKLGAATVSLQATGDRNHKDAKLDIEVAVRPKLVTAPTLTAVEGLVYNGGEQVGAQVNGSVEGSYVATGLSAEAAGNHLASVSPAEGYAWNDGTDDGSTAPVQLTWSIAKASPEITASPQSVLLDLDTGAPITVSAFQRGDGAFSFGVTSSGSGGSTVSLSTRFEPGNNSSATVTISPLAIGTTKVLVKTAETANYKAGQLNIDVEVRRSIAYVDIPTPRVSSSLTYDGTSQVGVSLDAADAANPAYRLEGEVSGVNAGTYTARIVLNSGYAWTGGARDDIEVVWTIGKSDALRVGSTSIRAEYDGTPHALATPNAFDSRTGAAVEAEILYLGEDGTFTNQAPSVVNANEESPLEVTFKAAETANYKESPVSIGTIIVAPVTSITDSGTGVVANGDVFANLNRDGNIVTLDVTDLSKSDDVEAAKRYREIRDAYYDESSMDSLTAYDVQLHLVNAQTDEIVRDLTEPADIGSLTLTLPVDEQYNGRSAKVRQLHGAEHEEIDKGTIAIGSGAVNVTVDRLSEFVLTVDSEKKDNETKPNPPGTETDPPGTKTETDSRETDSVIEPKTEPKTNPETEAERGPDSTKTRPATKNSSTPATGDSGTLAFAVTACLIAASCAGAALALRRQRTR